MTTRLHRKAIYHNYDSYFFSTIEGPNTMTHTSFMTQNTGLINNFMNQGYIPYFAQTMYSQIQDQSRNHFSRLFRTPTTTSPIERNGFNDRQDGFFLPASVGTIEEQPRNIDDSYQHSIMFHCGTPNVNEQAVREVHNVVQASCNESRRQFRHEQYRACQSNLTYNQRKEVNARRRARGQSLTLDERQEANARQREYRRNVTSKDRRMMLDSRNARYAARLAIPWSQSVTS